MRKMLQKKRTSANSRIWDRYHYENKIIKVYTRKNPVLPNLKKNQSVVYGNGKDYYYILEPKSGEVLLDHFLSEFYKSFCGIGDELGIDTKSLDKDVVRDLCEEFELKF